MVGLPRSERSTSPVGAAPERLGRMRKAEKTVTRLDHIMLWMIGIVGEEEDMKRACDDFKERFLSTLIHFQSLFKSCGHMMLHHGDSRHSHSLDADISERQTKHLQKIEKSVFDT